jgi:hypothetical protein
LPTLTVNDIWIIMIKDTKTLNKFEDDLIRHGRELSLVDKFNLLDAMWKEGVSLGVLPPKEPLEGLDVDIRIAKVLNSCLRNSSSR